MTDITRQRIQSRLEELDLSMNAASEMAGMDRSMLRKFLRGETKRLGHDRYASLARVLRTTVAYLVGETDTPEEGPAVSAGASNLDVPVVGIVETGAFRPTGWFESQNLGVIPNVRDPAFPDERQFAYLVRGDDMNLAGIVDGGAVVCVDPWSAGPQVSSGDYVVLETVSGGVSEFTIRELVVHRDGIELAPRSSNPIHAAITLPADADLRSGPERRVVGLVTTTLRRMTVKMGVRNTSVRDASALA